MPTLDQTPVLRSQAVGRSSLDRREFLKHLAMAAPLVALNTGCQPMRRRGGDHFSELSADLVIIGGGLGGCAAALSAARSGLRVIMTEETAWIGGQLTQQAVPPDENQWVETIGATRSYQALRTAIRDHYRTQYPITARARANPRLNPGNCWVSRIGAEPRVMLAVLHAMLAPYVASAHVRILQGYKAVRADVHGDRVRAISVRHIVTGHDASLQAPFFVDATELGDLLPMTGTEYVVGAESQAMTGEPHAKPDYQPDNVQGFTTCFAMDYLRGEDHVIPKPATYDVWRDKSLVGEDGQSYRLLSFDEPANTRIGFSPDARNGYWSYRRVLDRDLFAPGAFASDVTIVNWGLNDYSFGTIIDASDATVAYHLAQSKDLSRSLLYWLQTEAPRPDGGAGWKGLRLRPDIVGTEDGMAMYPYIRESRRIVAETTVLEQHVTTEARIRDTGLDARAVRAMPFDDAVGIGHYIMDLHLTTRGDRGRYGSTLPFQIPLGALLPKRMENLLPAAKNLGVTHLTNGCYRLHPIEWNIGESVGALIAFCRSRGTLPRAVRHTPALLRDYQAQLARDGIPLAWPAVLPT